MGRDTDASEVSLGGQTAKGTAAKFVTLLVGLAGTILFARLLGPAAYGGFYLLLAVVEIADRPIRGWARAGKKRFSEATAPQREILGAQLLALGAGNLVVIGAAAVFATPLSSYTDLGNASILFAALFLTTTTYVMFRQLVEARGLVGLSTWSNTLRNWTAFPAQLALILLGLGAAGMAYGYALATLLVIPVVVYYAAVSPTIPSRETIGSLWHYARYSIPNGLVGKTYSRFDQILLGILIAPGAVGLYEVAYRVSLPASFVSVVAGSVLMARVSNLLSKGDDVAEEIRSVLAVSSVLSIPLFFGAVALADEVVVTLYGSEFAGAAPLLIGLSVYQILRSQSKPLVNVVDGLDRPDVNLRLSVVTLAVNIVLGIALGLRFGAIGVVVATVIAEGIRYGGLLLFVRDQLSDVTLFPRPLAVQCCAGIVMFVSVSLVLQVVSVPSWYVLFAIVGGGALMYGGVLMAISAEIRQWVRHAVGSVRGG